MDKLEALANILSCEIRDIEVIDEETFKIEGKKYTFLDEWDAEAKSMDAAEQLANEAMAPLAEEHRKYFRFDDFCEDHFSIQNVGDFREIELEGYYYYIREN